MSTHGTIVTIDNRHRPVSTTDLYCVTNKEVQFYLLSFNNGILRIEPKVNTNIEKFALMVAKLFDPSSNFFGIKRVKFEFNGIPISVSAKKATPYLIVKQYKDKWEKHKKTFLNNESNITEEEY